MQVSDKEYRIEKKIGAGGGGDIFHTSLLAANPDLNSRVGDRKIIAKVMKSAGEKMFVQEVSIMAMFHSHKNVSY